MRSNRLRELAVALRKVSLGHSVESTISRSTTSTSSSNTSPNSGIPRQRTKTGRSAISSGETTLAGCLDALAAEPHANHLGAHGTVAEREALHRRVHVELVVVLRPREEQDRARRMLLREARERALRRFLPLLRHPCEVRHHARALIRRLPGRRRRVAQLGELAFDLATTVETAISAGARRGRRAAISSLALAGPHVPAA